MTYIAYYAQCTHPIITRGLYTFYPIFEEQKSSFKELFLKKFLPHVRLVLKRGFKSRAGYSGTGSLCSAAFGLEKCVIEVSVSEIIS